MACQKPSAPSAIASSGPITSPRRFRSSSSPFQDCAFSRTPSVRPTSSLLPSGVAPMITSRHCASQREQLGRQHDVTILATLPLHDADDHLRAVDVAGAQPNDLARAQPAAIAERQHDVHLEIARHGEQPLGLLRAHHQRQLLRLLEVVDLGGEIVPPQRDAEQKPHPRHDPVAIADAQPALDQVQLEAADVVSCRRVGPAPQKRGEAPAAVDLASLPAAPPLGGSHILDHTLAQRADGGISAHGELLLSEVANTSSSSGRGSPPCYKRALNSLPTPPTGTPAQRLSRQRFSALAPSVTARARAPISGAEGRPA